MPIPVRLFTKLISKASRLSGKAGLQWSIICLNCLLNFMSEPNQDSFGPATVPHVTPGSYLTLHYRLADASGQDIVTTFAGNPATLQIGSGQLAPFLEQLLFDLPEGAQQVFDILPEQGFGLRNPELLQWVARSTLEANSAPDSQYQIGDLVDFAAPGGGRFAGVLREMQAESALFDFNHPLAGQVLRFEVKIIGIL